jgi:hypothetical protein
MRKAAEPAGFLIVSTHRSLPPVLQYALSGPALSVTIDKLAKPFLDTRDSNLSFTRFIYFTSFHLFLEFSSKRKKDICWIRVPHLSRLRINNVDSFDRLPTDTFDSRRMHLLWRQISSSDRRASTEKDNYRVILTKAKPIRYNQACGSYQNDAAKLKTQPSGSNPCGQRGITGCTPVAFAMLLSSLKSSGIATSIWRGNSCWNVEWPSFGYAQHDPSQCEVVRSSIWTLHKALKTTADGATDTSNLQAAAPALLSAGLNTRYYQLHDLQPINDSDATNHIIYLTIYSSRIPVLWSGLGKWSGQTIEGHSTLVYGVDTGMFLVSFGWGESFADSWITTSQFTETSAFWVTDPNKTSKIKMR